MPLAQLHHSGEVTGADTCLRRPIIATASLDRSVRIWSYLDKCATLLCHHACLVYVPSTAPKRLQSPLSLSGCRILCRSLELVRDFTEEAHSIALHPSGYNVLVGFTDKLRLFAVLVDSLKCVRANPSPVQLVAWGSARRNALQGSCKADMQWQHSCPGYLPASVHLRAQQPGPRRDMRPSLLWQAFSFSAVPHVSLHEPCAQAARRVSHEGVQRLLF